MAGENLDIVDDPGDGDSSAGGHRHNRFVGVQFACCQTYSRVYVNRQGTAYVGNCPKCGKRVQLRIGPDGTDSRFFTAY